MCTEVELTGILLKYTLRWNDFIFFLLSIISCDCLLRSGLKRIFHWKAQLLINLENKDVPSANFLHLLLRSFGKSLTYIKNKNRYLEEHYTCTEGGAHPRISVWHLLMNLKNNYLFKKLLKCTNKNYKNLNI